LHYECGTLDASSSYQMPPIPEIIETKPGYERHKRQDRRCPVVISKKAIIAGFFSAIVGVGMLAMPVRAMARDWDHDGNRGRHEHHDNGRHNDWYMHGGGNGWTNHRGYNDGDERGYQGRSYYQQPVYGYRHEPAADDYGYGNGYGYGTPGYAYGYGSRGFAYPSNGEGMVNPRNPGLVWSCDSQGHHCHWAPRAGYGYPQTGLNPFGGLFGNNGYGNGYGNGYYGNSGYGNGNNSYYGNNAPMGGLGSLLGLIH